MIKNCYPLPLVSELMDKLKGSHYFTKINIHWGFNNIRIKEGDEHKAVFITTMDYSNRLSCSSGLRTHQPRFKQ